MGVYLATIKGREVRVAHGNRLEVETCPVCQAILELVKAHPGIGRHEIWKGVPPRLAPDPIGLHIQSLVAGGYLNRTTENRKPHVFRAAAPPPDELEVDRPEPKPPKPRKPVTSGDAYQLQQELLTAMDEAVSEAEQRIIDKIHQSPLWQRQAANAELVERIRLLEDENARLRAQLEAVKESMVALVRATREPGQRG